MFKKSTFRGSVEALFKAERLHFYHIYYSLWRKFRFKKPLWVICTILGLFLNPLTADNKDSLLNRGNLLQHFETQLSLKNFPSFFFFFLHFITLDAIFNIFKKKMTLIADVLWGTISTTIAFTGVIQYGKVAVVLLWTVFGPVYHVTCQRVPWNGPAEIFL